MWRGRRVARIVPPSAALALMSSAATVERKARAMKVTFSGDAVTIETTLEKARPSSTGKTLVRGTLDWRGVDADGTPIRLTGSLFSPLESAPSGSAVKTKGRK